MTVSGGTTLLQSGSTDLVELLSSIPLLAWQLLFLSGVAVSLAGLYWVSRPGGRWSRRLRARLLLGVPWATLGAIALVLYVYLFLQGGISDLHRPVTYAFQASGFSYPLGMLTASFSHTGFNHLFGNVAGALVFGSIAEYGFSHLASERGTTSFSSLRTNPFARVVAFFLGIVVFGLLLSLFSWGPIIGFSGVVFAMAGFALVVRPLTALVGLVITSNDVPRLLYNAIMTPISGVEPVANRGGVWFADIAIQGHLFGFLLGVVAATLLVRRRNERPDPARVWFAIVVYGLVQGLWVAYWVLGNEQYALFRGAGAAFVLVLGALIVAAVAGSDRNLLPNVSVLGQSLGEDGPSRWQTAVGIMVMIVLVMSIVGGLVNLAAIEQTDLPNDPVEIRDYQIGYSENVTNQQYAVVDIPGLEQAATVEASGVIVASADRNIWRVPATTRDLAFRGYSRVLVGGVGWREEVLVTRTGWSVVGGKSTYRVRLHTDDVRRTVHTSGAATSEVVIANRSIGMATVDEQFRILVGRNNTTIDSAELPEPGGNVTVGGVYFDRVKDRLYANFEGTRVQVANKREPRIQELRDD